jgi:hypothetical protein
LTVVEFGPFIALSRRKPAFWQTDFRLSVLEEVFMKFKMNRLAVAVVFAGVLSVMGASAAEIPPVDPALCAAVCSIYEGDAVTVIKKVNVTADSYDGLMDACANAAGLFAHPWSISENTCPS